MGVKKSIGKLDKTHYLLTFNQDWADEHDVPAMDCFNEKEFTDFKKSRRSCNAHLGNGGEGFGEGIEGKTGLQLIREKLVEVTRVDESFNKYFKKADLAGLSLCNIFTDEYEGDDEEEEENSLEQGEEYDEEY